MSYTLRTAQAAKLLEERCDLHYNHNAGCPAKEFFASDCPFAKPCGQATKEGWVRVLEKSGPNTLYSEKRYRCKVYLQLCVDAEVEAASEHMANNRACEMAERMFSGNNAYNVCTESQVRKEDWR